MKKKFLSLFGVLLLCSTMIMGEVSVHAYSIDGPEMFCRQQEKDTCTLASAVMLLRRKAALLNDDYKLITEANLKKVAWNPGLYWNFTFSTNKYNYKVEHASIDGYNNAKDITGKEKINVLLSWLKNHREGVCLYARHNVNHYTGGSHCVLLTDYTNGKFYGADPAGNLGRVALEKVSKVTIENAASIWYVSSVTNSNGKKVTTPTQVYANNNVGSVNSLANTKMTLSTTYYTYNNQLKIPAATIKVNGKTLSKSHYTLHYTYSKNVGKYSVKAVGKSGYIGVKYAYYYIMPKAVTISSLIKKKKGFTVKYKKVQGNVKYQIAYRIKNGKWKYAYSSHISHLKSKKNYQVKVRAYNNGAYGPYGKVKTVKTK